MKCSNHHPTHQDIRRFFGRFQLALDARSLTVLGITTDAESMEKLGVIG